MMLLMDKVAFADVGGGRAEADRVPRYNGETLFYGCLRSRSLQAMFDWRGDSQRVINLTDCSIS